MAGYTVTPTNARKDFFNLLKKVNEDHQEIEIISDKTGNDAVLLSLSDWRSIQETLFLEQTGTMDLVRRRELDDSGTTNVDDVDWDNL